MQRLLMENIQDSLSDIFQARVMFGYYCDLISKVRAHNPEPDAKNKKVIELISTHCKTIVDETVKLSDKTHEFIGLFNRMRFALAYFVERYGKLQNNKNVNEHSKIEASLSHVNEVLKNLEHFSLDFEKEMGELTKQSTNAISTIMSSLPGSDAFPEAEKQLKRSEKELEDLFKNFEKVREEYEKKKMKELIQL